MLYLLFFISLFATSQSAALIRLANTPLELIGFWRMFLASLVLLPYFLKRKHYLELRQAGKNAWILCICSGVFLCLHFATYMYSAQHTKIANCMILFAVNPLFVAIGSYFFMKEKITVHLGVAYVVAITGVYMLVRQSVAFEPEQLSGDLVALVSAAFFSGYIMTGRQARKYVNNTSYTLIIYSVTAFLFLLLLSARQLDLLSLTPRAWMCIAGLVVLPTITGHALFTYLLKFMNINVMSCAKLIEPAMAALTAYFIFSEAMSFNTFLAFLLTSVSVFILFFPKLHKALRPAAK